MPGLIDTHCHLNLEPLSADPTGAWARAREAGVEAAIVVGVDLDSSRRAVELAREVPELYAAVGFHPNAAHDIDDASWQQIEALAGEPGVVALGESGFDFYWDKSPEAAQRDALERHADASLRLDLPLVLHIRDAYPLAAEALEPWAARGLRGVVHCFAGVPAEAEPFLEWGWPLSFSGIVTYSGAQNVRDTAALAPLEQCLLETDAPWLTPRQRGRQTNEPAFVTHTAKAVARAKGLSVDEVTRTTTANARRVFSLGDSAGPGG